MSCSICLKDILIGARRIECGHEFCTPCIYSWSSIHSNNTNNFKEYNFSCPLCRRICKMIPNSPTWYVNGEWRTFEIQKDSPLVELTDYDIQIIKDEFSFETIEKIEEPENGIIAHVTNSIIKIGTYENYNYISNCIVLQRYDGRAYPTFPRLQNFEEVGILYKIR